MLNIEFYHLVIEHITTKIRTNKKEKKRKRRESDKTNNWKDDMLQFNVVNQSSCIIFALAYIVI